jgi:hypothetical protein
MKEAFVYLWYDALNKMYYLGKHKGSPDDTYTHSSTIWESFTKDNIPEGVTRRILAYGTDEEMCILEHELLVNRKKRCWNRYYNNSLGDPRYVDTSGENAWNWKGGITYDMKSYMKEYHKTPKYKEYRSTPKYKALKNESDRRYRKKIQHTPEYKEYYRKRRETLECKEYQEKYQKERNQTLEHKLYMKEYAQKPEVKEYQSKYRSTPEYKEHKKKYDAERHARKKAERQGEGNLKAFLK